MFDIGWMELMVIGVVALIVIGPQDLPDLFRQLGRITGKMRMMARDFQRAMDEAAKESGVSDVTRDLKNITSPKNLGLNAVKEAADKFEKWDPLKTPKAAPKPPVTRTPPVAATPAGVSTLAPVAAATAAPAGPNTQALRDKQAERQEIVADATARLRAVNLGASGPDVTPAAPEADAS